uniref:Neur_chan_memb domain-containing protein n=1 Tax=Macrostomum lignano TaxID=282301 RepID=A0A1I8FAG3_9PLAT
DLTITITSERPDTEIELIPDEAEMSGINIQTFVDQQEWRLHEHIESHPCLAVRCRAGRRPGYFYWNVFLIMVSLCESGPEFWVHRSLGGVRFLGFGNTATSAPAPRGHLAASSPPAFQFFITGLSFATFAVGADKPEAGCSSHFTLFLTSVAFKFVINQSLPKISYLTYMYVLMSLAILCIVSIWHAVVTMIQPPNLGGSAGRVNQTTRAETASLARQLADRLRECFLQAESGEPCSRHLRRMEMVEQDREGRLHQLQRAVRAGTPSSFIFWLYYDACRRRREMRKKDREYKEWLNKKKEWHKKALEIANARRTSTVLNKIQFYQMVESHGRGANRKNSVGADLARRQHHQHHHRRNHNQLTGGAR